jgi:chromosome partitioning protein
MRIISITNHKGGVGKTTTTINLGAALKILGKKVLMIDIDPQAQTTNGLGIKNFKKTIYHILKGEAKPEEVIINRNNIYVIPSNIDLAAAEVELINEYGREFLLKKAMKNIKNFDFILIDCPPNLGLLTVNALTYAKEIFIPIQTHYFPLEGVGKLLNTIKLVKERLNPDVEITGVICTMVNKHRNLDREVKDGIYKFFKDKVFKTFIRENILLAEAPSFGKTIFEHAPRSNGAEDYLNLAKEILGKK